MRQYRLRRCVALGGVVLLSVGAVLAEECVAPPQWFPSNGQTPETDYTIKPDPKVDCDFYKIAWQTFLFVTQGDKAVDRVPRFLKYATPNDLFNGNHLLAFPKRQGQYQLLLTPRLTKPRHSNSLESVNQAVENGVLVDQNGRAVYYGVHLNNTFAEFIRANGFTDLDKYRNADATLEFPVGCVELKSSWRIVGRNEDRAKVEKRWLTVDALLAKIKTDTQGNVVVDPGDPIPETVALVGLHVVVRTEGHPEFIWTTFEHVDNAPDVPAGVVLTSNKSVTDKEWTFCAPNTPANKCNINPRKNAANPLKLVNAAAQLLEPKGLVCREFPFGGDDPRGVVSLSASVHEKLGRELAVWKNYELIGGVWLDDPAASFKENKQEFAESEVAGSTMLSSSTMETFTQHTPNGAPENCFTCHTTGPVLVGNQVLPGKRLNISHALNNSFIQAMQAKAAKASGGQ
jgi:hypothetical protein